MPKIPAPIYSEGAPNSSDSPLMPLPSPIGTPQTLFCYPRQCPYRNEPTNPPPPHQRRWEVGDYTGGRGWTTPIIRMHGIGRREDGMGMMEGNPTTGEDVIARFALCICPPKLATSFCVDLQGIIIIIIIVNYYYYLYYYYYCLIVILIIRARSLELPLCRESIVSLSALN